MTSEVCEFTVKGMDCGSCAGKVRGAVERIDGVEDVEVSHIAEKLTLKLDGSKTDRAAIKKAVSKVGYEIDDHSDHTHVHEIDPDKHWYETTKSRHVLLAGAVLAVAWVLALIAPTLSVWAFVAATVIGLLPVARKAFALLITGQPFTIESLMTIAAIGALIIGEAQEAALVVFLFAVGEVLEGVAATKARASIRGLSELIPKSAWLEENGATREVPASDLKIDQIVVVRPGDRIPADGVITEGTSGIDESPITGESVPLTKSEGDPVYAGAINTEAVLRVRVTKEAHDNTIARIVELVEEAESARAPTERFIDRFSRWYMPTVVGIALLTVLIPPLLLAQPWETWIYRGLALLLIGCPCALVISVPAAIASALSTGARQGLLMKGGAVIETTAAIKQIAFDKTGTLTRGTPQVTKIIALQGDEADVLRTAAAVENGSSHPLAVAILDRFADTPFKVENAKAIAGKGVTATLDGQTISVLSPSAANIDDDQVAMLEAEGQTVVVVSRDNRPIGYIALRDEPRDDAKSALAELREMGIGATILTGDNERTAAAIAGELDVDFKAKLMPEDKLSAIRGMAGPVMMIGDGINDAPALKQADVGVAMGSGTDVALETADAAILRSRVVDVPRMIRLARMTMGNIRQNIGIALGLKAVFLVTSILGITGLWIAILADTGATVLVTINAMRLLRAKP
ncbi:cadmium-translocating P-type ATPase [Marivivens donghaensis]|uniref:P-type Zn(2+) transporter n=1 Tax=Marivivens donghaensis TaxID=1699413 RepID=A0ABX0W3F9_9RHOB|nr:heavy metal translocating P-type ATPase [Marivivens donghaensis]NIY73922.1 cadmium-translocating P-type ATPase [Marivivens donghaensis]